jgi:hypothetical protein
VVKADPTNTVFQLAAKFVNQTDKHLFLTGKAGTGKTTFLKYIKENCFKRMIIVAPTGVAAINAGGVTIHSFFQLPFGPFVMGHKTGWNENIPVTNQHTLFKNMRFTAEKRKIIEDLEILVIDEVSMMRCDMLDAIDHVLRHFRKRPYEPFGGVQMVYIGDLHQLPPVTKNDEWELLKENYNSPFFFDAQAIQKQPPLFIELKKIYRQSESTFINILNNIRNNRIIQEDLEVLHRYFQPDFIPAKEDNYITLTSHNSRADNINNKELDRLPGKAMCYSGTIKDEFNEKALPVEMNIYLKEGTQVMFLKNDKGEKRRFFNGKIGVVTKLENDKIVVQFPGSTDELEVEKETWQNIKYRINEETGKYEEEEIGSYTQYPIRLAWAITIHKSQGLTFEKAIIDAGASFAAGQVYVALSRLTSLDGLILYSQINNNSISSDPRVIEFIQKELSEESLIKILEQEQILYSNRFLLKSFEWIKVITAIKELISDYNSRVIPNKEEAVKWAGEILNMALKQNDTAKKFSVQLKQLMVESEDNYDRLNERVLKAQEYFDEQLAQLNALIASHREKYTGKKKVKKYITELNSLRGTIERKRRELKNAVEMADNLKNIKEKDQASASHQELLHIDQGQISLLPATPLHQ